MDLICTEVPELEMDCELVCIKLPIVGCKTLYLGSFYRPPDITDLEYLDQLNSSLKRIVAYNAYTDGLKLSFFPRTIATWNGLTTETVSAETVDRFKSKNNDLGLGGTWLGMPVPEDCL